MSEHTVVLAAHGGGEGSRANDAVRALGERVRHEFGARGVSIDVVVAFNLGEPHFSAVLDQIEAQRVTVVPVMLSRGYFASTVLPAALQENAAFERTDIRITTPIGLQRPLLERVCARIRDAAREAGFDETSLDVVVVGHGTRRTRASAATTKGLSYLLTQAMPGATVHDAYLDQDPLLEDLAPDLKRDTLVVPWLLGGAGHEFDDVRSRLGLEVDDREAPVVFDRGDHRVLIERAVLSEPMLPGLIAALVIDGEAHRTVRLGTRKSRLAMVQARAVAEAIESTGARCDTIALDTFGDLDKQKPIEAFDADDLFTRELEQALLEGRIDVVQHSAKDLSLGVRTDVVIAACLPRGAVEEALVSHRGATLGDLPAGAVVGTSGAKRRAQLLRVRPDLRCEPIRGNVEQRVAQVREGRFDATILAVAGLERLGLAGEIAEAWPTEQFMPAAGQGAIALQIRAGDHPTSECVMRVDDQNTRSAVEAELAFARTSCALTGWSAAAIAETDPARGIIRLRGRLIANDASQCIDVAGEGPNACDLGERLAREALASIPHRVGSLA